MSFEHILAHYEVSLKGSNGQLRGFCPLPPHQGKGKGKRSPSFSANKEARNSYFSMSFTVSRARFAELRL
jgi:hypothetical protein